jgi:lipopolysaccharide biosynthesis protein
VHARIAQFLSAFEPGTPFTNGPMKVRWSTAPTTAPAPRIAVILHAHYPDVALELIEAVNDMGLTFDLFVTTSRDDVSDALERTVTTNARTVTVFDVENFGRDVMPFLRILDTLNLDQYNAVLKLHTKRTVGQSYGDAWREEIVGQLIPAASNVASFLARLESTGWGILGPSRFLLSDSSRFWGANRARTARLRRRFAYTGGANGLEFFAGTMFWFKPAALQNLPDIVREESWEKERGQLDGTLAHAIERTVVDVARANGYTIGSSDEPYRDLPDSTTTTNAYPGAR